MDVPIFGESLIVDMKLLIGDRNPLIVDKETLIAMSFPLKGDKNPLIDITVLSPTPLVPCIRGGMHVTLGRKL